MLKTTIVQKCLLRGQDRKVLLLKRSETDNRRPLEWDLPGGQLEHGEDFLSGIRREVLEETGLAIKTTTLVWSTTKHRRWTNGEANVVFLYYLGDTDDSIVHLSFEHSEFKWCELAEAQSLIEYDLQREFLGYVSDNQLEL